MDKRVVVGVGGGLLLALGLVLGVIVGPSLQALAAGSHPAAAKTTPTPSNYCQLYEQTVLQNLPGVTQQQLEAANKAGAQAVINKLRTDGKITQAQQAQAQQELTEYASNPCAAIEAAAKAHASANNGATSGQSQALSAVRASLLTAVATPLKTTSATLQSELAGGKTIAQITSAQGASKSAVDQAYLAAVQAQLAKAVSGGSLTQAQSDLAYSYIQQAVAAGHYPLLDTGDSFGAFGPMSPASTTSGQ